MEDSKLTQSEKIFATRMIPHLNAGLSFEDAAKAVLEDDIRLFSASMASDHNLSINKNDQWLPCQTSSGQAGSVFRQSMARIVYERLRTTIHVCDGK